jgi:hypothetical protein
VTVNGVPCYGLEHGQDPALHDGDVVALSVIFLGGG